VPIKNEVAQAVYTMLEALTVYHDRKDLIVHIERAADDFNALLSRARQAFPGASLVQKIEPLSDHDRVIVLVARLAVLKSAIDSQLIGLNRGYVLGQSFRYWLHSSGRYYAVEFRRGSVSAVCGPITVEDLDSGVLPHLPYERGELLQWVEQHRSEFTVYTAA
jgi:hypothetical protein